MSKTCFVIFSTADWKTPYWTNKQHMALQFEGKGFDVLYVETPGIRAPHLTDKRDLKRIFSRLLKGIFSPFWQASDGITICSPLAWPWAKKSKVITWVNNAIVRFLVRLHLKRREITRFIVWTYHPFIPTFAEAYKAAYHCVDDLTAVPGVNALEFDEKENQLLQKVDFVFVTSRALAEKCSKISENVVEFSNVVDFEHFSSAYAQSEEPEDLKCIPHPRIGYVGVLSDFKLDFELIEELVNRNSHWSWVFIGEEREGQADARIKRLRKAPNVHFLGYKAYQDLPRYLAFLDLGTLPTLLNEYTRSMSPMKFYEYISSGLRVVATGLEFCRRIPGGVAVANDPIDFENKIRLQLVLGRLTPVEAAEIVGHNTWSTRAKKMLTILQIDV